MVPAAHSWAVAWVRSPWRGVEEDSLCHDAEPDWARGPDWWGLAGTMGLARGCALPEDRISSSSFLCLCLCMGVWNLCVCACGCVSVCACVLGAAQIRASPLTAICSSCGAFSSRMSRTGPLVLGPTFAQGRGVLAPRGPRG